MEIGHVGNVANLHAFSSCLFLPSINAIIKEQFSWLRMSAAKPPPNIGGKNYGCANSSTENDRTAFYCVEFEHTFTSSWSIHRASRLCRDPGYYCRGHRHHGHFPRQLDRPL